MPELDVTAIGGSGRVVFHGDDLGLNRAVTEGILRAFAEGLLTSTSLLANAPDAERALQRWKLLDERRASGSLPSAKTRRALDDPPRPFDLGIHLNLTQGRPLTGSGYPLELLDSDGRFLGPGPLFWRLCRHRRAVRAGVKEELRRQTQFLLDHGLEPTHLNGHQYVEMMPVVAELIPEVLNEFSIGVARVAREPRLWQSTLGHRCCVQRWMLGLVKRVFARSLGRRLARLPIAHPAAFFGTVHAGSIDMQLIRIFLQRLAPSAVVEIGLHPAETPGLPAGDSGADGWEDPLAAQRPGELRLLLSAELPQYLAAQGYRLGRLGDLRAN